ncbi:hypothetical protein SAMN04488557_2212 [Hyphomicrobium facile]|uniref:Uncharacterized protein n=1 Tax=Hyphomicrobium facile TaxID=51670 RepID=A0A1I7NHD1_9HYPH|nr:hypothetical protein SAMN04488557_2212 [Hyphomicrobium facile]
MPCVEWALAWGGTELKILRLSMGCAIALRIRGHRFWVAPAGVSFGFLKK